MSLESLHPRHWGWEFYVVSAAVLLTINFFGPKGMIHWFTAKQQIERYDQEIAQIQGDIQATKNEIAAFKSSDGAKLRAIREELGYLVEDELSVEFIKQTQSPAPKGR